LSEDLGNKMNNLLYGSVMVWETEKGSSCNTKVLRLKKGWLKLP